MCEIGTSMVGLIILQAICMLNAREQENHFYDNRSFNTF